jgi:hypothetical protein
VTRFRPGVVETIVITALFVMSCGVSYIAMRGFRAAGIQPFFYQTNFEPAVMMACGRGFGVAPSSPPELGAFLLAQRDDFDCTLLPASLLSRPLTSPASANWYYLYVTAAMVWRVAGVSWTALDVLVAAFGGVVAVLLYGLFRLVAGRIAAAALALLLIISPANLTQLLSLRDYSKAPFMLAAVLILAVMVMRPARQAATLALAGLYGAVVGFGYGFRGDLAVMVPFGALVVFLFLPGSFKGNLGRNGLAMATLLAGFLVVAWPVLSGLKQGGCQFHFALLGLTTPLTTELRLTPSLYRFGDHLSDTFVDLKVGDYAWRVLHEPVPGLCGSAYDTASGQLYSKMATTFPADLTARAYASVLMILRTGMTTPGATLPAMPFRSGAAMTSIYRTLNAVTSLISPLGVIATLAAIALAWASSARLGLALTVFVLFLTGYPAIQFEGRHWFHLRFIPWWASAIVGRQILHRGVHGWMRPSLVRAAAGVAGLLIALAVALGVLRFVQTREVGSLIAQYGAATTEEIATEPQDGSFLGVRWRPRDYGLPPAHRASDLLVVTLDSSNCDGQEPLVLKVKYETDLPSHDMSVDFTMRRPKIGAEPTRVYVPVFWQGTGNHTDLRFSGLEVVGAPLACVGRVARVTEGSSLPLWLEMQVPADWSQQRLYESMRAPRFLAGLIQGPLR